MRSPEAEVSRVTLRPSAAAISPKALNDTFKESPAPAWISVTLSVLSNWMLPSGEEDEIRRTDDGGIESEGRFRPARVNVKRRDVLESEIGAERDRTVLGGEEQGIEAAKSKRAARRPGNDVADADEREIWSGPPHRSRWLGHPLG